MDINSFIDKCFKQGFHIEKYGLLGETLNEGENHLKTDGIQEKWVEKEVIVEKRVEIPVEVIKEVEKIIEVPVEVIKEIIVEKEVIKEVPVEKVVTKIEYISDKQNENELFGKIEQLEEKIFQLNEELESERQIFSTKTQEMENIFQNEMSKKDENLDELRRSLDIKLDEHKVKMLTETLTKLKKELAEKNKNIEDLQIKIKELESIKINQGAVFMKGSNLTQNL
jgi:predicted RNase H-like nuclease (RuvC/YqgF family)